MIIMKEVHKWVDIGQIGKTDFEDHHTEVDLIWDKISEEEISEKETEEFLGPTLDLP